MQVLQDGTCYEDDPISDSDRICAGDDLVFILPSCAQEREKRYSDINRRVVSVRHVSADGSIAVETNSFSWGIHFVRECFHRIIEKECMLNGFDDALR